MKMNFLSRTSMSKFWNFIRKPLIWTLFIAGFLLAFSCYYTLFFTTMPVERMAPPSCNSAPEKNDFKIAVFGDWMIASGAIEKIAAESSKRNVDFAVCLGDFVHPAQTSVLRIAVEKLKENFKVPVYATPGNHDVYNAQDAAGFGSVFGDVNNCFAHGDTLFILLDSAKIGLDEAQLQYLKFVLEKERPKYRRCVIFTHVPPVTIPAFDKPKYRMKKENSAELQKIVEAGKVDLIVCGHAHCEMDIKWGTVRVLVIPPCGQGSRNPDNPQYGSLQLHFQGDGSIKPEFVYCGNEVTKNKFQYFIYRRLNQRSIFFCVAMAMILCGMILAMTGQRISKSE